MILIYLLTNLDLVLQFVGIGETYISHRADMSLDVYGFWEYFREAFLYNDQHNMDFHRFFLPVIMGVICIFAIRSFKMKSRISDEEKSQGRLLIYVFSLLLLLYIFAAVWNVELVVRLRERLGGLGSFNASRVIWLMPAGWYFLLGVSLDYLIICLRMVRWRTVRGVAQSVVYLGMCAGLLLILKENQLKENVQLLLNPDYGVITYENYYAIDLMDELE
ncbi:MAG: DUF6044 family protein, partial [Lachnospiraceae bacterium]|nr:DUF6044 family protein [Lachnospiraceae bacterium]